MVGFGLSSASVGRNPPPARQESGLHSTSSPWHTSRQKPQDQATPEFAPPSAPANRNPPSRDGPPVADQLASAGKDSSRDRNGPLPSVSAISSPFGPAQNNLAKKSRFQDDIDPDLHAAVGKGRFEDVPVSIPAAVVEKVLNLQKVPPPVSKPLEPSEASRSGETAIEAGGISTSSEVVTSGILDVEWAPTPHGEVTGDETPTQAPKSTSNDEPISSSSKPTKKYRFKDEIDPDLLASGHTTRKMRTWVDLNAPLRSVSPAPAVAIDSDPPPTAWRRKMPIMQAGTPTPVWGPKRSNVAGVPVHLVLVNKRPRTRSCSPPCFVPDTPPHKRQQQEYHGKIGAIDFTPRLPKDEIEDLDTFSERPKPSHKRQEPDIPSSPTKSTTPVRKRQRILIQREDTIEDGPDSSSPPRVPQTDTIERINDASSNGDEVAEHTDGIDHAAGFGTLLEAPSVPQAPKSTSSRRLLDPDAMRLYFKSTKPAPKSPPLKPGMINILTHHKRIIVPKDPTPPPASPPRTGYINEGLAETAMWWKHDAQERHKRMFTEDKPTLTSRVLIREFLRDDKMCFIKGPGENKDGKEGNVRIVVTDRAAEAVTKKGATLLYEGPWFEVRLLGEEEPYRFLIGSWRIEQTTPQKKGNKKTNEAGLGV